MAQQAAGKEQLNEWTELLKNSTVAKRSQLQNSILCVLGIIFTEDFLILCLSFQ